MVLSTAVLFVSCSNKTNNGTNNVSSSKAFTVDELKKYNGQNGNPAYVAVSGIVYDVTNARGWKNGRHENGIVAGMDLTSALSQSPHGDSVLKELPIVGKLK
jgi:predicted heme/steroid binding protein